MDKTKLNTLATALVADLAKQIDGHKAQVVTLEGAIEGIKLFMQELGKLDGKEESARAEIQEASQDSGTI